MKARELKTKLRIYWYIAAALFTVLLVRLAVVQFLQNETYETMSKYNRIRLVSIKAPRGEIYTSDGEVLAKNKLVYTVSLSNLEVANKGAIEKELAEILGDRYPEITPQYIETLIEKQKYRLYEPVTIIRDIDWDMVVRLEERRKDLPGVTVTVEPLRYYPQKTLAGHILGYVRSIDPDELARFDKERYRMGDLVGKDGVEKSYETYLKGYDGARRVEVDVRGRPVKELVTLEPRSGNNVYLTVDSRLQKVMEQSIVQTLQYLQKNYNPKARVASCVLLNVKTGEVLAMASYPFFNPNDFTGFMDTATEDYYFPKGDYDPMSPGAASNRAIRAVYPPGSTFKGITGMAALERGKLDPQSDYINCQGRYWLPPKIKCTDAHGPVNLYKAMAVSCNTFFQEMGRRAGKDEIIRVAREFGLGARTGIDLPYEKEGLLPTPEWKKEVNAILFDRKYDKLRRELDVKYERLLAAATSDDERQRLLREKRSESAKLEANYRIDYRFNTTWQAFDTFNMSIGQGSNSYTVMQLANYAATVANGGKRMRPYVVKKVVSPAGKVILENRPRVEESVDVSSGTLAEIRKAFLQVTKPGGTAYGLFAHFPPNIQVAAKTGTAQTGRKGDRRNEEFHGVFIAFAPFDNPEIAFAGVVEYGQHGYTSAGRIARDLFEQYFGIRDHLAPKKPLVIAPAGRKPASSERDAGTKPPAPGNNPEETPVEPEVYVEFTGE